MKDPSEFISVGEKRQCRVLDVDVKGRKIGLSLLEPGVKNPTPRDGKPPTSSERSNDSRGAPLQGPGKRQPDGNDSRRSFPTGPSAGPRRPQGKQMRTHFRAKKP